MKSITKIEKVMTVVVLGLATGVFACCVAKDASALSVGDGLILNPVYEAYLDDVAMGKGSDWNIIPSKYVQSRTSKGSFIVRDSGTASLPTAYSLLDDGYGTEIKNQGADDTCWAYALATTLESTLLRSKNVAVELSPKQLDYLTSTGTPYSDYLVSKFGNSATHVVGDGHSFGYASYAMTNEFTPVKASDFFVRMQNNDSSLANYDSYEQYQNRAREFFVLMSTFGGILQPYSKSMANNDIMGEQPPYVVTEYTNLSRNPADVDAIKERIYNNGAVYVETIAPNTTGCWDATTNTIIDKGATECSVDSLHALALVGWDDDYTYNNGAGKGAFLAQNSWGTTEVISKFKGADYYNILEQLVSFGLLTEDYLTEENAAALGERIENYNAYEYVHLAYDYQWKSDSGAVIKFISFDDLSVNEYENIYDIIDTKDGEGGVLGSEKIDETYSYTTESGIGEKVTSIAVANHLFPIAYDVTYKIYIDTTGTGDNYQLFGTVDVPTGVYGQKRVDATSDVTVTGDFKVKVAPFVGNTPMKLVYQDENGNTTDLGEYFTTAVYTEEIPGQGGGDEPGEDPDPEPDPGPDVPGTGLFTKEFGGAFGVASVLVVALGAVFVMGKVYTNRKSVFHRVKFGKK